MKAASPLREWFADLTTSRTLGMDGATPRARPPVFAAMCVVPVVLALLRDHFGIGTAPRAQGLQVIVGVSACLAILALGHSRSLRAVRLRTWAILASAVGFHLVFWYFGRKDTYTRWFGGRPASIDSFARLGGMAFLSLNAFGWRLVAPLFFARFVLGARAGELGFRRTTGSGLPHVGLVYLGLFCAVLPFVVVASAGSAFLRTYPYSREIVDSSGAMHLSHFVLCELLYLLVFCSGEALWRGYVIFGLERDLGLYGIALMVVPYAASHFGKPLPEVLGAIIAGSVLGVLALKHRSFWFGVPLHYGIALAMDACAIVRSGIHLR